MARKRKREAQVVVRSDDGSYSQIDEPIDEEIFRKYFEKHYKPLEENVKAGGAVQNASSDVASQSDWEGLSSEGSSSSAEVIHYAAKLDIKGMDTDMPDPKSFMSAKPPIAKSISSGEEEDRTTSRASAEETASDAINLKHDVELQRLLAESHLLEKSSESSLSHIHRHKAMDLRIQSLGAKSSLFAQKRMPLSHHQGIIAKAKHRESIRRQESKENGIVLAKEAKTSGAKRVRRQRSVGGPSVGKFQGATLNLSSRDIGRIHGPGSQPKSVGRGRV